MSEVLSPEPSPPGPGRLPPPASPGPAQPVDFSTTLDERTKAFTVAAALLALFLAALDQTIVATAMPRIAQELNGFELYTWVTTAYILASTAMVPIYGKLSDIYGRKAVLLTGVVLFVVASAACGASNGMSMLIAMRVVQGIGAAALTSTAFAVVADLYEPRKRAKVQGFFGAVFGLSSVIGPVLGGAMTEHISWRSVFYVNVPLGAIAVAFILAKMPALKNGLDATIDYLGALLIVVGSVALMLGLTLDKDAHPWNSPEIVGLLAGGAAALVLFVVVESKVRDPVLPLRLFRNYAFASSALVSFLFGGAFFAGILFIPIFMLAVVGVSETASGTTLMPLSISMVAIAATTGQLAGRTGRVKPFALAGFVLCVVAFFVLSRMDVGTTQAGVTLRMVLLGIGIGPNLPLLTMSVQSAVERRDIGIATGARQFFQQLGGAFGAAVLGAVFAASLQTGMKANMAPLLERMPPEQRAKFEQMKPGRSFGREGGGEKADPAAEATRHIETEFAAVEADLDAAALKDDAEAKARLLANPRVTGRMKGLLDAPPKVRAQLLPGAKMLLRKAKESALADAGKLATDIHEAVRASFAAAISRLFLWAMGLSILTLVAGLFLKDQRLHGVEVAHTPTEM